MIHLPTTGEIECDDCGETMEVDLTSFCGDPETVGFDSSDLPEGWVANETFEGEHLCPECRDPRSGVD